ncbi:MAG: bifunctional folylpolyglutamate synthase/dihydrofolate synthase [Bacteroidales bacterium]
MTYEECLKIMFNSLPMYQRQGKAAYKADLNRTLAIDKHYHHPHKNWKSIHVAGTNGKGSVSHMLASVLQEAGYKTGLYTSPHLKDFRERIKVNGIMIPESFVMDFMEEGLDYFRELSASFFEMTVALAFDYFRTEKVDVAIVEVGMGGRLDSTNIITPLASVITNIGLDHTAFLGKDVQSIAGEKAGIIKPDVPVILGTDDPVVEEVVHETCLKHNTRWISAPKKVSLSNVGIESGMRNYKVSGYNGIDAITCDLAGTYQQWNLQTALAVIEQVNSILPVNRSAIKQGLSKVIKNTGMMGRWQKLRSSPAVYCDVAHNKEGLFHVMEQLEAVRKGKLFFILGVVDDKALNRILPVFPKDANYIFTQANIPRALSATILQKEASHYALSGKVIDNVKLAYNYALSIAAPNDTIFVGGSTFTVAEIL